MKFKDLVLGLIVLLILYLIYIWFLTDSTKVYLISSIINAKTPAPPTISASELPKRLTNDFTYSFWTYIDSWETDVTKNKIILRRPHDDSGDKDGIKIYFTKFVNDLQIDLAQISPENGEYEENKSCSVKNIPLQKWVNIIVSLNNRACDVYLDGKLVNTCVYNGVISEAGKTGSSSIYIGSGNENKNEDVGGFEGSISNLLYFSRAINPREAYSIYKQGPGGGSSILNLINKYKLKFAFMSNGKEINSISI